MAEFLLIEDGGGLTLAASSGEAENLLRGTLSIGTLYRLERVGRVNANKALHPAEDTPKPAAKKAAKKVK